MKKNHLKYPVLFIVFVLCLLLFTLNCGDKGNKPGLEKLTAALQAKLDEITTHKDVPGATLSVVLPDGQAISLASGMADVEKNIKMVPIDRMFSGSIGKTYLVPLILQLQKENKLKLDDPVKKYFAGEEWYSRLPNGEDLTLRMLLNHTGGIPRYVGKAALWETSKKDPDKTWTPVERLEYILGDPPVHPAGKGWGYSDTNYIILGMIIEKISGNSYYEELIKKVLKPLKLKQTTPADKRVLEGLVPGYSRLAGPPFNIEGKVLSDDGKYIFNPQLEWTGGGLITTSLELARWAKWLYEGKVLNQDVQEKIQDAAKVGDGVSYGLGVFIHETEFGTTYGHSGFVPGYNSVMDYMPKHKISIALQFNCDYVSPLLKKGLHQVTTEFFRIVIDSLNKKVPGAGEKVGTEKKESILDRAVHIEPKLITEIPQVSRWCDRLELKKERIDVGDAELYVEEEGKGTALILINGGPGGTHHYFHPWFSRLKDTARIIYYDQRGCGLSDFKPGKDGYSVKQAIDDLDAIRRSKKIDKWVLLGYSYGGFLAQYYTTHYPEHVAGLVLLGASPGMYADTGKSRQGDFLSEKEDERMDKIRQEARALKKEKNLSQRELLQILIYNNFINGDWKRQNFYKPSPERFAQIALYEWDNDSGFNGIMGSSQGKVDLTGAFAHNPAPTLILEGKWDLTWGEKKPEVLKKNHPHAKMVMIDNAGHGIYDENPEKFFTVLRDFIQNLSPVSEADIAAYKESLIEWEKEIEQKKRDNPEYLMKFIGWGQASSEKMARAYTKEALDKFESGTEFLRIGFALYDVANYAEALFVFEKMQAVVQEDEDKIDKAFALIWQGHMLDLLGKRERAIACYRRAAEMNIDISVMHSQYGLEYEISPYAKERMKTPFERIENNSLD